MKKLNRLHCSPVTAQTPRLKKAEIEQMQADLPGWEMHSIKSERQITKSFRFGDFTKAMAFTNRIARLANREDHHPAILTEWGKVTVSWWTHKVRGLTMNDMIMAAKTDQLDKDMSQPKKTGDPGEI
jgi:4a-hydroxytetrahydrobiopterin dehydratase